MGSPKSNSIAILFSAYCSTNFGEIVCITGNCVELGLWNPSKGLKLQTDSKEYPIWFSKNPIVLQKMINIQYKICVLGPEGNIIRWQNLPHNRNLFLKTSCSVFLTEGEGQAEYDFQNQDTTSTQINSTYKKRLSQIEEESDDDESVHSNKEEETSNLFEDRKRSGSSGKNTTNPDLIQNVQNGEQHQMQKSQIDKRCSSVKLKGV